MQLVTGTVVEGKVVLSGVTLPEGAVVTVLAQVRPHIYTEVLAWQLQLPPTQSFKHCASEVLTRGDQQVFDDATCSRTTTKRLGGTNLTLWRSAIYYAAL